MSFGDNRESFATTDWSVVAQATAGDTPDAKLAFAKLIEVYWYPCYAFLRRKGVGCHDAEDRLQQFFLSLLENDRVRLADRSRGRFRSFIISALQQFVRREYRYMTAAKRKPSTPFMRLESGESRYAFEPVGEITAERLFDYTWAVEVVRNAVDRLHEECRQDGREQHFIVLKSFLTGDRSTSGKQAAERLGISETAVRAYVYRLKRKLGRILRDEVSHTVEGSTTTEDELNELMRCLQIK